MKWRVLQGTALAFAGALTALVAASVPWRSHAPQRIERAPIASEAAVTGQLAAIQHRLAELERRRPVAATAIRTDQSASGELDHVTDDDARNRDGEVGTARGARSDDERTEEHLAQIDEALQAEPPDPAFGRQAWNGLSAAFAGAEFAGTRMRSLECGSTLCRADVEHDAVEAAEAFSPAFFSHPEIRSIFQGAVYHRRTLPDGRSAGQIFLARTGYRIPPPQHTPNEGAGVE